MDKQPPTLATVESSDCIVVINLAKLTNAVFLKSSGTLKLYFSGTRQEVTLVGDDAAKMMTFLCLRSYRIVKPLSAGNSSYQQKSVKQRN